jgi:hypothetical protein
VGKDDLPENTFEVFFTHRLFHKKLRHIHAAMTANFIGTPFLEEWQSLQSTTDDAAPSTRYIEPHSTKTLCVML